jgi:hypothetical protein
LALIFNISKTTPLSPGLIRIFSVIRCKVRIVGNKNVVLKKRYAISDRKNKVIANCLYSLEYFRNLGAFLFSVTCIFTIVAKFCGNNLSHTQNFATSPSSSSPDVSLSLLGWRRRACFLGELDDKVNPGYVLTLVPIGKETAPTVA